MKQTLFGLSILFLFCVALMFEPFIPKEFVLWGDFKKDVF